MLGVALSTRLQVRPYRKPPLIDRIWFGSCYLLLLLVRRDSNGQPVLLRLFMKVDSTSEALMLVTDPGALSFVTTDIGRCNSRSTRR